MNDRRRQLLNEIKLFLIGHVDNGLRLSTINLMAEDFVSTIMREENRLLAEELKEQIQTEILQPGDCIRSEPKSDNITKIDYPVGAIGRIGQGEIE